MKIGDLSKRTGCSVQTIRYYEREGLLSAPGRSDGNFRLYDEAQLERLSFVRNCRALDMTLDEIRALLHFKDAGGQDCSEVNALVDEHLSHVEVRITELQSLATQLKSLRAKCGYSDEVAACGILRGLSEAQEPATTASAVVHVAGSHSHIR